MSRPNRKKHSGNKIEIKIELTYAFSNRIHVWESGRSVKKMNQNKKRSKKVDKFKDYINKRIKEYEAEVGKKGVWSPHLTYLVYLVDLVYLVYLVCLAHMREA